MVNTALVIFGMMMLAGILFTTQMMVSSQEKILIVNEENNFGYKEIALMQGSVDYGLPSDGEGMDIEKPKPPTGGIVGITVNIGLSLVLLLLIVAAYLVYFKPKASIRKS